MFIDLKCIHSNNFKTKEDFSSLTHDYKNHKIDLEIILKYYNRTKTKGYVVACSQFTKFIYINPVSSK